MNRLEAAADLRKRREMMNIVAQELREKIRRMSKTAFPTHPVCKNAVQSCTKSNVARSPGHHDSRNRQWPLSERYSLSAACRTLLTDGVVNRRRATKRVTP